MKKSIQLQIADPCHENWDSMSTSEKGRFCASCQKEVIDFTNMNDRQIMTTLDTNPGSLCGHLHSDQLNRDLIEANKPAGRLKYLWAILLSSFVITQRTQAQGLISLKKSPVKVNTIAPDEKNASTIFSQKKMTIFGRVVSESGEAIPYASVMLDKMEQGIGADSNGVFIFSVPLAKYQQLEISGAGFEKASIEIKPNTLLIDAGEVVLKTKQLNEVVVVGYGRTTGKLSYTGAVSTVQGQMSTSGDTLWKQAKNFIGAALSTSRIKVYPNPVQQNQPVSINCNVNGTGKYGLLIFDASGRLVHSESIFINTKQQLISFDPKLQTAGTYFIKLAGKKDEVYEAKLVVR